MMQYNLKTALNINILMQIVYTKCTYALTNHWSKFLKFDFSLDQYAYHFWMEGVCTINYLLTSVDLNG